MLGILAVAAAAIVAAAPMAATDQKAPRIVAAVMQDADGDGRADRVRLTYSERVRHVADRDGRYPLRVSGYTVRSVGPGRGRSVVVVLAEKQFGDGEARPVVRYRRTHSKPVADRAGNQARGQRFTGTRAHGPGPTGPVTPDPTTNPEVDPTPVDRDGDGTANGQDCAPDDPARHPKAPDLPDLGFVDSNCDGIDGTEAKAIFVSPQGKDANPGTKAAPKRQIQAAVVAAAAAGKDVYAAAGSYNRVEVASGVGVYGGYDPKTWTRTLAPGTAISGGPEGILADGDTEVTLQLLSVTGRSKDVPGASSYGMRVANGSKLTLQRVVVRAGPGSQGAPGANGARGAPGKPGADGLLGWCDNTYADPTSRAPGGAGASGRDGGSGGYGGYDGTDGNGAEGALGKLGTASGLGGAGGDPGHRGYPGARGAVGLDGPPGAGGTSSTGSAGATWKGAGGSIGRYGAPGMGGGGGGGGGGQTGIFVVDGQGNFGGGGGGGGASGDRGQGGGFGGGSFGIYLHDSTLSADGGSIQSGAGGVGGAGGRGGAGGPGGAPGLGGTRCLSQIGAGGDGGPGGAGGTSGGGGGGAGGPSVGVMKLGTSGVTLTGVTIEIGAPGAGGATGAGGSGSSVPAQAGIAAPVWPA
jgi:hypothetical protein